MHPDLNGILLVNKPATWGSSDVVRKLKRLLPKKHKIGHGGTLDPFATGLLIILIGEATKIADYMLHDSKEYTGEALIGHETDTADIDGDPTVEADSVPDSIDAFHAVRERFLGRITQKPPIYSAIKVKGKPLYKYARAGETAEIPEKSVEVFAFDFDSYEKHQSSARLRFRVQCGGGTYIRSLLRDTAVAAGTRAHLTSLCRTQVGSFKLTDAHELEDIVENGLAGKLISITDALSGLPQLDCPEDIAGPIRSGNQQALHQVLLQNINLLSQTQPATMLLKCRQQPLAILAKQPPLTGRYAFQRVFN